MRVTRPRIVVLGSLVVDWVVRLPHLPRRHETLLATAATRHLGGKGFNQAVAAARCGADVALVGAVGPDDGWAALRALLDAEGIDRRGVRVVPTAHTGFALPMVLPDGDNSIVLVPGANAALGAEDADGAAAALAGASALLVQQEVPRAASARAAEHARARGVPVFLDPAPAVDDGGALLAGCDWLLPNEQEASQLVGRPVHTPDDALGAAVELLGRGPRAGVVITLGDRGCVAVTADGARLAVPARPVDAVVDPTGAGDAFRGAFAVAWAEGAGLRAALALGAAAGAHAVGHLGAEPGLARRPELERSRAS